MGWWLIHQAVWQSIQGSTHMSLHYTPRQLLVAQYDRRFVVGKVVASLSQISDGTGDRLGILFAKGRKTGLCRRFNCLDLGRSAVEVEDLPVAM